MNISLIYDLIFVLIFVFLVARGWRTGLFASLLRLLGWVLALFLVLKFSQGLADWIYINLLHEPILNAVNAAIPQELINAMNSGTMAAQDALTALQEVLNDLSGFLGSRSLDIGSAEAILVLMEQDGMSLAQSLTETVLRPVITPLLQAGVSLLIFLVCVGLFRSLARLSARINRHRGLVGTANSLLGAAVGLAESAAVAFLYAYMLSFLAKGLALSWLNPALLAQTKLVQLLIK